MELSKQQYAHLIRQIEKSIKVADPPAAVLPKRDKPKRALSKYQLYMKEKLAEMKGREYRRLNQKEKFKLAAQQYRRHVQRQEDAEHQQAVEAENAAENRERAARSHAILQKTGRIPKKKKPPPLSAEDEAFYQDLVK